MKFQLPKNHYEATWGYLDSVMPSVFTPSMKMTGVDPTYSDFYQTVVPPEAYNDPKYTSFVNVYYHLYHMKQAGDKIYYVTPNLAARLAQTTVNVDSYFIRSPFRELFVQIDPGLFFIKDADGSEHPVQGFYVYLRDFETYKQLRIMACALLKPTKEIAYNDVTFYFKIEITEGKVKEQITKYIQDRLIDQADEIKRFEGYRNVMYLEDFMNFVLNVLLYITSKSPDFSTYVPEDLSKKLDGIKSAAKKRKLEQRIQRAGTHKIIIVGSSIQDPDDIINDIQKAGGVGAWKLQNRVRVSGHWRAQWYGNEKEGTRRAETIWISDYEKGPEFAEMVKSQYVVK
jgi:hypothetical protein